MKLNVLIVKQTIPKLIFLYYFFFNFLRYAKFWKIFQIKFVYVKVSNVKKKMQELFIV